MAQALNSLRLRVRAVYNDLVLRRSRVRIEPAHEPTFEHEPIFIVGLYRSGTTLLRYVLDSHTQIACPPETSFLVHLAAMSSDERSITGFDGMGIDRHHLLLRLRSFSSYFYENYVSVSGKERWADKSPEYVRHLDFVYEIYPRAKYILVWRHPLDQIHSHTRGGSYREERLRPYHTDGADVRVAAARYWVAMTRHIVAFLEQHPDSCFSIKYEDLTLSPTDVLPGLFRFLGVEWEDSVLDFSSSRHDAGLEDSKIRATRGFEYSGGSYVSWDPKILSVCKGLVEDVARRSGYDLDGRP